jgi:hypothetical protein
METGRCDFALSDANGLTALGYTSATRGLRGSSKEFDAAEWAIHRRPEMSRKGADDAVHPVRRGVDVPLVVRRVDGRIQPGRRVIVDERVEQAALVVEAGAAPRDEDAEVPTPPPSTLTCIPNASPLEQHAMPLVAY